MDPNSVPQSYWQENARRIVEGLSPIEIAKMQKNPGGISFEDMIAQWVAEEFARLPESERKQWEKGDTDGIDAAPGTPEYYEERTINLAEKTDEENRRAYDELAGLPLTELQARFGLSSQEAQAAHDQFVAAVNSRVVPPIPPELEEIASQAAQAKADPEAVAAQRRALGKAEAQTTLQETPEERFMREQSRRTQERDLRAQREANKSSLLRRGAYGSGAEVAMNAQAEQEGAERRMLEELGANANAQKRALAAIGQMADISGTMRGQSFDEAYRTGSVADTVRNWNRQYKEDHARWVRGEQKADEGTEIRDADAVRASAVDKIGKDDARAQALWGAKLNLPEGTTGNRTSGAQGVAGALARPGVRLYNEEMAEKIEGDGGGFLGDDGVLGIKGIPFL